jgi:DNA-binding transcriptional LysR family regulator
MIGYPGNMTLSSDLQLRQLQAFVTVTEERSFGKAAERLGFTQSGVSQQIASLEKLVGQPLFDRPGGPKPVEITPAGDLLLAGARGVLDRLRVLETDLDRLRRGEVGSLAIGAFQSASVRLLPSAIGRLHTERPEVGIRIVETDDQDYLLEQLLTGEIDTTFAVDMPSTDKRFVVRPLCSDPYVVLAPKGAETDPLPVKRLAEVDLIGAPPGACQNLIDSHLNSQQVITEYVFRSADNSAIQALVRARMGYAVMPWLAVDPSDPGIDVLSVSPALPPRRISLVTKANRTSSPALDRFCELIETAAAELAV